jgi:DNA-binding LacI/PurR family transcriptional regulator
MNHTKKTQKSATMRDVARLAGVSQPTVSRVLNQTNTSISISDETRSKVLAAVEELSYRPNMLARGLRTQKTQMIAVLIADISNSFYHGIVRAIQDVAREHNYDVMIANSDHLYESEQHFCEAVTRRPVDGVVMVPQHLTEDDLDDFIARTNSPLVVLGQHITHPYLDVIYAEDERAVYEATRWLSDDLGHRRLGLINVPQDLPPGPRRLRGFLRAVADAGLQGTPEHVVMGDFTLDGGARAAQQLLRSDALPTALVAMNDLMAIGAMLALQNAGLRVPEDIAIIGYDNIPETMIVRPTLTTIAHDPADIGRKLATCLFERIQGLDVPGRRIETLTRLIIRGSTGTS